MQLESLVTEETFCKGKSVKYLAPAYLSCDLKVLKTCIAF